MTASPYPFQLVAHRGNASEFPENTLPAFQSALDLGLKQLELDIQLAADGVPMIIHDARLERTAGVGGSVFDMPSPQLQKVEVAEVVRFGERHRGTTIPRLTDVLQLLDGRPDVRIFVEIKKESLRRFGHDQVVGQVLEAIRPAQPQCVVISYDLPAIVRARQLAGATIGWVLDDYHERTRLECESLRPEFLFGNQKPLAPRQMLWRGPWEWVIFEVVSLPLAASLSARGAHHIETMAVRAMSEAMQALRPE